MKENSNNSKKSAAVLWALRSSGETIEKLPDSCNLLDENEGREAQTYYEELSNQAIAGWKIAATSKGGQQHIGVSGPLEGPYLESHIYSSGSILSMFGNHMAVAEAEFAFCIGQTLDAREEAYSREEIVAAVASLHPSLEFPDSRIADFSNAGAAALLADCACSKDWVIGTPTNEDWKSVDLAACPVRLYINDEVATEGTGLDALDSPLNALEWVVNRIIGRGISIQAGQYITTGVCGLPKPIRAGDKVTADLGIFGKASASLVD